MRFYVASLLAFSDLQIEGAETGSYSECIPAFIPAESMQKAAETARGILFERWKSEEGWHTHQANIMALGEQQFETMVEAEEAGILDLSDEEPQTFNFSLPGHSRMLFASGKTQGA